MPSPLNLRIRHGLGLLMLGIGAMLLVRLYILGQPPRVVSKAVETMLAIFFVMRGSLGLYFSRRMLRATPEPVTAPGSTKDS